MDADLSHPPSAIPEMVGLLTSKAADFTIGSRYTKGGTIDQSWSFFRRLNSILATLPAFFLTRIKDPMSGFFACRKKELPDFKLLDPIGYKIGLEILVKGSFNQVKEIPIHFSDRQFGQSKLSLKEQFKYLVHLLRLYQFSHPKSTKLVLYAWWVFPDFLWIPAFIWDCSEY
jgi:dolichol-phosphate mannosyltransferase